MNESLTAIDEPVMGTSEGTMPAVGSVNQRRAVAMQNNGNAATHRIHSAKKAVIQFGSRAINKRTRSGRQWKELRASLFAELNVTSEKDLTAVQLTEVEILATELWLIRNLEAYIINLDSIVVRRTKTVLPVIEQHSALVTSYEKRRAQFRKLLVVKPADDDLQKYIASVGAPGAAMDEEL